MVIAIDGPAGSGKSTIAKLLAQGLASPGKPFIYVNSGNLYRAITLGCLRNNIDPKDPVQAPEYAKGAAIEYREDGDVYLDGENVASQLHTDEIDRYVAPLSAIVPIRHVVNDLVRSIARGHNVVTEGRDITTVVFPQAEYRFYLDASADSRAKRRFDQGFSQLSLEEIRRSIEERDAIDKNKAEGSLKIAPDVTYLDTSDLTINQVYETLITKIQIEGSSMGQMEVESDAGPMDESEGSKSSNSADNVQTQLQEQYLKSMEQLEEGQLINGVVIQVTQDQVFIDVGYKSEGKIPISEFDEIPNIGDSGRCCSADTPG
ncbi:hypothetical protein FACS189483_07340 [Spirochaetia bacterium]|nr:hypothetical protein FACS189483_07340 [Spirochaetia bacterium]